MQDPLRVNTMDELCREHFSTVANTIVIGDGFTEENCTELNVAVHRSELIRKYSGCILPYTGQVQTIVCVEAQPGTHVQ